ncbi:MAG: class I SAM-dependent methyltransferase [Bacteroidota bacterium]
MSVPFSTHFYWLQRAFNYYSKAQTQYDVHAPFLSDWVAQVLEDERFFYIFDDVEEVRRYWINTKQKIQFETDYGAGSRAGQGKERSVAQLAKWSGVDAYTGELLFRMVQYAKPTTILELGTNLGLSALYMRAAARSAQFITIEGQEVVAKLAGISFERANLPVPTIKCGTFTDQLPSALTELQKLDFVFLDGDHRGDATLAYFRQMLPYLHEESVVVVGDIHWSGEMEEAWRQLCDDNAVKLSVDLFHFGVLFFRKEHQAKEHFTLIRKKWKPWRLGFF